jgi:hypothetical protein
LEEDSDHEEAKKPKEDRRIIVARIQMTLNDDSLTMTDCQNAFLNAETTLYSVPPTSCLLPEAEDSSAFNGDNDYVISDSTFVPVNSDK